MRANVQAPAPPLAAPPPFRQTTLSQVDLREGGGCLSLFGLPFLIAGLFLTLAGSGVVPIQNASDVPAWSWPLMVAMGLVFTAVGGTLVFGRRWTTFDLSRGCLVRQHGWLTPMRTTERSLSEFSAVVLAFESGDSDSSDRYPVRLRAWAGKDFTITSPIRFGESRAQAEFLSRFLRLPLVDTSTGHELALAPERAGETLQERLRSGGAEAGRVPPPAAMRCQVKQSGPNATIVIPGRGSVPAALAVSIIPVVFLLLLAPNLLRFFRQTGTPEAVQFAFLGSLILMFGVLPLLGAGSRVLGIKRSRTVVTASTAEIVIERQGAWRRHTTRISASDVLGIDYSTVDARFESARRSRQQRAVETGQPAYPLPGPGVSRLIAVLRKLVPSKGLIVKTRQDLLVVGEGLAADELRYLQSILTRALAGAEDVT